MIEAAPPPPAAAASAPAEAAAAVPLSATVIVSCSIGPGEITRDCTTDPDRTHPGAAEAVLTSLSDRPLRLPGARLEQRLTIGLVRANLGKAHAFGPPPAKPYEPAEITAEAGADIARYYPERAARMMAQGDSLVRCKATDEGRLDECWVRGEAPSGYGFGVAELVLAMKVMRIPPPGAGAPAYDWRSFDVPMTWRLPPAARAPAGTP